MSRPVTIPTQARALRSLTGLSLSKCRRILVLVDQEFSRNRVMKFRRTSATRQLELQEAPVSWQDVSAEFSRLRNEMEVGG